MHPDREWGRVDGAQRSEIYQTTGLLGHGHGRIEKALKEIDRFGMESRGPDAKTATMIT